MSLLYIYIYIYECVYFFFHSMSSIELVIFSGIYKHTKSLINIIFKTCNHVSLNILAQENKDP